MKNVSLVFLISILFTNTSHSFSLFGGSPETFDEMATKMAAKFSAPVITLKQFKEIKDENDVVVLDARELEEFNVSHVKNSIFVGYDNFSLRNVKQKISKDKKVIVYCSVGYRSGDIAERLKDAGYDSHNLYGGLFGWVNSQEQIYSESIETQRIHGFSKKWGKWLERGEVVY